METNTSGVAARRRHDASGIIRCKGIIVLVVWLVAGCLQPVSAQSWQTLLKDALQSLGGSSETAQQPAATPVAPSADELQGTWIYQAPAVTYTGSDMVATLAVTTLKGQLPAYYQQSGLQPGSGTFAFEDNGVFRVVLGTQRLAGTYLYDAATGVLTVTYPIEGKPTSFNGKAALADGTLTLLFEASETFRTMRTASSKFSQNQRAQQISAILDAYPGIMMGAEFRK